MSTPTVIGLGELLWDEFADSRRPGGAPANVAFHANQLGACGRPASRVGCDADGEALLTTLQARGLDTELIQRDPTAPTGRVTVQVLAAGQPEYVIHEHVAWEHMQATPDLLAACAAASAVCFGTLAQRTAVAHDAIGRCLTAAGPQTLIVYDVNLRQHWYTANVIAASARAADVVKLNDQELTILAALFQTGQGAEAFAARLFNWGVDTVIVTRGAQGCTVLQPGTTVEAASESVRIVDTVGAGDAFTAAYIVGRLRGWPAERSARLANRIGGLVAARAGAMPDIRAEASQCLAACASEP
jgi:fructokinase